MADEVRLVQNSVPMPSDVRLHGFATRHICAVEQRFLRGSRCDACLRSVFHLAAIELRTTADVRKHVLDHASAAITSASTIALTNRQAAAEFAGASPGGCNASPNQQRTADSVNKLGSASARS